MASYANHLHLLHVAFYHNTQVKFKFGCCSFYYSRFVPLNQHIADFQFLPCLLNILDFYTMFFYHNTQAKGLLLILLYSPHDEHLPCSPRPVKLCSDQEIFQFLFRCIYQGFQSGPVPGTFTRLRSFIVPAKITEPPPKLAVVKTTSTMVDRLVEYCS